MRVSTAATILGCGCAGLAGFGAVWLLLSPADPAVGLTEPISTDTVERGERMTPAAEYRAISVWGQWPYRAELDDLATGSLGQWVGSSEPISRAQQAQALESLYDRTHRAPLMIASLAEAAGVPLNDEQAARLVDALGSRQAVEHRLAWRLDANGDGALDAQERQAMREISAWLAEQELQGVFEELDADGDGHPDMGSAAIFLDELTEAAQRATLDADLDGRVDATEMAAFTKRYERRERSCDLNLDGVVDAHDWRAFESIVVDDRIR